MTLQRARVAGQVCLISGVLLSLMGPLNDAYIVDGRFIDTPALRLANVVFALIPLALAWAVLTFQQLGFAGSGWLPKVGAGLALVGLASWLAGGVVLSINPTADELFTPLGGVTQAIGYILLGIATLRAGKLSGWRRILPLVLGLWFFIQLPLQFPRIVAGGLPSYTLLLGVWGILWAVFGYVLMTESRQYVATPVQG